MNEQSSETRLDRIERGLEAFLESMRAFHKAQLKTDAQIAELRESQLITSAQIAELREAQKINDAQIAELRESQLITSAQIAELREAQLKTDAQIAELRESQLITSAQIAELREAQKINDAQIAELRESQKITSAQIAELREAQLKTDAQIAELREAQLKTDAQIAELREAQLKTDEQLSELRKSHLLTEAQMRRTDATVERVAKQLGELGLVQGEVAEDLFYRNVPYLFKPLFKSPLESIHRNLRPKGRRDLGEYDIVADSGRRVLVIEVKNKLSKKYVDDFIQRKLPRFKDLFPQYLDKEVMGGIGALVVKDDVGRYAEDAGLYVLTQTETGGATILNRKNFKPKVFR